VRTPRSPTSELDIRGFNTAGYFLLYVSACNLETACFKCDIATTTTTITTQLCGHLSIKPETIRQEDERSRERTAGHSRENARRVVDKSRKHNRVRFLVRISFIPAAQLIDMPLFCKLTPRVVHVSSACTRLSSCGRTGAPFSSVMIDNNDQSIRRSMETPRRNRSLSSFNGKVVQLLPRAASSSEL